MRRFCEFLQEFVLLLTVCSIALAVFGMGFVLLLAFENGVLPHALIGVIVFACAIGGWVLSD